MPRMHVVATTINSPLFLDSYRRNFEIYGRLGDVKIWVIGDRKTPGDAQDLTNEQARRGLNVEYLDPDAQEDWLRRFPELAAIIPWNSDNRRNVGFLRALEEGCEVLVSIDDDNFCLDDSDFYAGHEHTGATREHELVSSDEGWFNICGELKLRENVSVVPRGFPHAKRNAPWKTLTPRMVSVVANAGLWLGDPDVDAATRLAFPVEAIDSRRREFALVPGTWTPINTQNTSVARRAIPAYYYIRMLEPLPGARLDRYGDIWSGYFLTRCAQHMGESIGVGLPLVSHKRNAHDLLADLRCEFWGMMLTPHLIDWLRSNELNGADYAEAAKSLSYVLEKGADTLEERVSVTGVSEYVGRIASCLRIWVDVCGYLAPVTESVKA